MTGEEIAEYVEDVARRGRSFSLGLTTMRLNGIGNAEGLRRIEIAVDAFVRTLDEAVMELRAERIKNGEG